MKSTEEGQRPSHGDDRSSNESSERRSRSNRKRSRQKQTSRSRPHHRREGQEDGDGAAKARGGGDTSDSSTSESDQSRSDESSSGGSSNSISSETDSEDEREKQRRRRRRRKRQREKEEEEERGREKRRRGSEKKRKRHEKSRRDEDKERKRKKKKKRKRDKAERGKVGPVTDSWGKYGIIKEIDMWVKRPEFSAWLAEVKKANLETMAGWEEKQMFKEYMEDFNTATLPKKYYDLDAYHRRKIMKAAEKGLRMKQVERTEFNDEEQRRLELKKEREQRKEAEIEALKRSMQGGMAQAMREQAQLREEMQYQYRLGNNEAAAAIQRRLEPDAPGGATK